MSLRRMASAVLAGLMLVGLLAGCGGSGSSGGSSSQAGSGGTSASPAGSGAQTAGSKGPELSGPNIDKIKKRGKLLVGTKHDVPKFGYKDPETNKVDGYEIDLIRRVAKAVLGDENAFETQHVTPKTRMELLNNGDVDFVVATMTITEQRRTEVDFSPVYYTDGIGLLVKKGSPIKKLQDMSGKTLGVVKGASTGPRMQAKAKDLGIEFKLVEFESYPDIKKALLAGQVDAMSTDGAILAGYVDGQTAMLAERYTQEPYGIATKKGNDDLQKLVDKVVTDMESSGELAKLQDKWGIRVGA